MSSYRRWAEVLCEFLRSRLESGRIRLRILFRRTPPQREAEWTRVSDRAPLASDARHDGMLEIYNARTDWLSLAYVWSLPQPSMSAASHYYWRPIPVPEIPNRHFQYWLRSQTIFR